MQTRTRARPDKISTITTAAGSPPGVLGHQIAHVRSHLERLRKGEANLADPEKWFLGHEEGDHFWELVGIRLPQSPAPLVVALRFRRHDFPGESHARESLASYLSTPGTQTAGALLPQPNTLAMLMPRIADPVPTFLNQLRAGHIPGVTELDPSSIEVAFDLRTHNPSFLGSLRRSSIPLKPRFFRTTRGHVLSGSSPDPNDPHQPGDFLSIKGPVQHTPKGKLVLPDLAINRKFILLSANISKDDARIAAPNWAAFAAQSANSLHLLLADPPKRSAT